MSYKCAPYDAGKAAGRRLVPHPNTEKTSPVLGALAAVVVCLSAMAFMSLLGGSAWADESGAVGFLSGHGELTPSE